MNVNETVSGQLPPKKNALPPDNCPRGQLPPDDFHLDYCSRIIAPGQLPQRWLPPDNIPLEIAPKENCLSNDLSPTNGPKENSSQKNLCILIYLRKGQANGVLRKWSTNMETR